ncbi:Alanine racemase [Candidatus Magnetomoraceae bacterium gMMP-15]
MNLNYLVIDLSAIKHNYNQIKKLSGHNVQIMSIVKSDAYGHGLIPVSRALESAGCSYFGVFDLDEAIALRNAGIKHPILILMGLMSEQIEDAAFYNVIPGLYRWDTAQKLSEASLKQKKITPVHVKVDTGMGRIGVLPEDLPDFMQRLSTLPGIRVEGIFSHFSVADEPLNPYTDMQLKRFEKGLEPLESKIKRGVHIANSGGILNKTGLNFSIIRPGITLYGSLPASGLKVEKILKPAMTFKSRIIYIKTVPTGTAISYGMTYITQRKTKIATIPVGYNDGYNRLLSNSGKVLIRGAFAPVVGKICMNLTMIDISHINDASIDDEVVLLGRQGERVITAEDIADKIGSINYEVYCLLGKCNPKIYVEN